MVELADRANERTAAYSGGMKRRLNIAIGLLHRPRLLVLDEPTVGVDPQSRNAILASVEALGAEGIGILYTTHYMEEAERLCHRIGVMDQGGSSPRAAATSSSRLVGGTDRVCLVRRVTSRPRRWPSGRCRACRGHAARGRHRRPAARREAAACRSSWTRHARRGDVRSVEVIEPDLEAVFLQLTGKALRD